MCLRWGFVKTLHLRDLNGLGFEPRSCQRFLRQETCFTLSLYIWVCGHSQNLSKFVKCQKTYSTMWKYWQRGWLWYVSFTFWRKFLWSLEWSQRRISSIVAIARASVKTPSWPDYRFSFSGRVWLCFFQAQDRIGKLQDIYCKYLLSYDLLPQVKLFSRNRIIILIFTGQTSLVNYWVVNW